MSVATAAVIGGGPAGLIAAETLSAAGVAVTLYERMPTPGRKLLMAGRGGLNLTHAEPLERFVTRYGAAATRLRPIIEAFPPKALVAWAEGLGQQTFVGSSGRVFPAAMKASPLLRAVLLRLAAQSVEMRMRHDWLGWDAAGKLLFATPHGASAAPADATILALGGASWPKLGSTGGWAPILARRGIEIAPFRPANCGFETAWSRVFQARFAGTPLKNVALSFGGVTVRGEAMITGTGIEGGAVYALSAPLRDAIAAAGTAVLSLDLAPDLTADRLALRLDRPRRGQSTANYLRKALGLAPVAVNLLREAHGADAACDPAALARRIKSVALTLTAPRPIERAISTAGGIALAELDDALMLRALPGVFAAGEMLDWEAPTGGYLLQASFATGIAAARAALRRLEVGGR